MGRTINPALPECWNAELTNPLPSDGTVWHGRERMRLIGKGFSSSTDETVPVCATVPLGLAGTDAKVRRRDGLCLYGFRNDIIKAGHFG
jgi:hypothetical protein